MFRNIIWQTKERVKKGEIYPVNELLRTFWYMYIKPTLTRADALSYETDQYIQLIDTFVYMVKDWQVMEYKDIGFRDDKKNSRIEQNPIDLGNISKGINKYIEEHQK